MKIEVWGDRALFTRPEMKVERVTYEVMTPAAARGIIEAIYWHPGVRWIIDSIQVCNPIRYTNIRRNEVKSKIPTQKVVAAMKNGSGSLYLDTSADRQQRNSRVLKDVRYIIEAHVEIVPHEPKENGDRINKNKAMDIISKRLKRGKCFAQPYMGCKEFTAYFREFHGDVQISRSLIGERDLGFMLYDMDFHEDRTCSPLYFRAKMVDGLIKVPSPDSTEVYR